MRKFIGMFAAGALLFAPVGTAEAKVISWRGTLDVALELLPPIRAIGGGAMNLNSSAGTGHLNTFDIFDPGLIAGGDTIPLPSIPTLASLRGQVSLGTGIIGEISGGATSGSPLSPNILPVAGIVKLCLVAGCSNFLPIPLTVNGTRGVGIGGLITINGFGAGGIKISALANPWTIKSTVLTNVQATIGGALGTVTAFGFAHGPASQTSSTATEGGVVQLVTAVRVTTNIGGSGPPDDAMFATLRILFIPEPATFLLFGSGVVAMGIVGRRRAKKN
jgi:hypothetical protein